MEVGKKYRVVTLNNCQNGKRLRQLGLRNGSEFTVRHQAPLTHDPIAIEVNGSLVALRRQEATCLVLEEVIS